MQTITLGSTGIQTVQNAFGALPIQRVSDQMAVDILHRAFKGGMRYFDTARAYSDSEHKVGLAFGDATGMREKVWIASKTAATTPEGFWTDLETSLSQLQTSYIDVHQFHCVNQVWRPGDGSGMYECMQQAKAQGKIRHIGVTAHKIEVAFDLVESGLYEVLQFPLSYLSGTREEELVALCKERNVGFVAMKGLAGGLITNSRAAMAYMTKFDNVLPIWGVQKLSELKKWLSYMDETPCLDAQTQEFIRQESQALAGDFCRGCGYCMPCPQGIMINQAARISLMVRRAPSQSWLASDMQAEMNKIPSCTHCYACRARCPYDLDIPELLLKNYQDYREILAGNRSVNDRLR